MDKKKIEELKTKVEQMKKKANILKVSELAGEVFSMQVTNASMVVGKYGDQLMIVGTVDNEDSRIYLTGRRAQTFENAFEGEGEYAFVFGEAVTLEGGNQYIPLELVEKLD